MCLTLTVSKIKERPVKVYKILRYPELTSPVYKQSWVFDKVERVYISDTNDVCDVEKNYSGDIILSMYRGFHSFRTLNKANMIAGRGERIFEAEIPAHAPYICGDYGDVISWALLIKPYWYKPVKILGFRFFIRKKIKENRIKLKKE